MQGIVATVIGQGFVDLEELSCRFGAQEQKAYFVTTTAVLCSVFLENPGNYSVGVTANSIDIATWWHEFRAFAILVVHQCGRVEEVCWVT